VKGLHPSIEVDLSFARDIGIIRNNGTSAKAAVAPPMHARIQQQGLVRAGKIARQGFVFRHQVIRCIANGVI
jgi:hypothetical protein